MIYLNLVFNLALLVALSIISGFIEKHKPQRGRLAEILQGMLFGGAAVVGMLRPLDLGAGLIFDGRSVMISLCALYFGPWAAVAAVVMPIGCRVWIGGMGTVMGVLVILSSMSIGIVAHFRVKPESGVSVRTLYIFGLAVHVAMIAMIFVLPAKSILPTLHNIGLPVILLYPLATILGGKVLADQAFASRSVEELRKTKQNLEVTLQSMGEAVISTDPEGRIVLMNPEAERLIGWSSEAARGKNLAEVFKIKHTDTQEADLNPVETVLRTDTTSGWANHSILVASDGTERHITSTAAPIRHENGDVSGVVLVFRDVTETYRTQQALRESEETYRRLFQDHAAVQMIMDPETGSILDVNEAATQYYGWPRERLMQMNIQNINTLPPEDIRKAMQKIKDQNRIHFEFCHRRADGSIRDVEVFSSRIVTTGKEVFHSIVHDIADRKRAEVERERLLAAIEQAGEAVCITNLDGRIEYVNPAFESVTGYTCAEVIGKNPRILKSGAQNNEFYRNLWKTITSGKTWKGEFINCKRSGERYAEEATISPVCDASGRIIQFVAVKRDITEHQQLTAQLMQAQKMESVGRLAGGVAHDFNNMLTVILGHTEMLLAEAEPGLPLHADLSAIQDAAGKSARITRQLLAFARRQTIVPKILDLNHTIDGMLKMLRRLIGEDIELVWHPDSQLWPVRMDPSQIDQVLANLCVNARDSINGIGRITIETKNIELDRALDDTQSDFQPGEFAMLAVSDSGCGMNKETLTQIFEPFFTTKELGRGTGLGLSTVYGIVRQNKGFINVHSEPGKGTTFKIYIPREMKQEEIEVRENTLRDSEPHGSETLLLVEDESSILKLGKTALERLGYIVLAAETPRMAIQLAEKHAGTIQLLITDLIMPEMNGKELAKRLKIVRPDIKCLFMSGYTDTVIANHGVLEPGIHFLAKPFSIQELATKVRGAIESNPMAHSKLTDA